MVKLLRLIKTRDVALDYIDRLLAVFPEVAPAPAVSPPQRCSPLAPDRAAHGVGRDSDHKAQGLPTRDAEELLARSAFVRREWH